MAYQVLARRYRPQTFAEVIGQEHVTRVLAGAIAAGRVAHGYLFSGPRGVGKTSTARILAKALNCERGPTPTPCNTCSTCTQITAGSHLDVLEIDGASSGGIDQVRELRENARYAPSGGGGKKKLYIIDEVHQVTAHGFNALLKTLEEPPAHVVFILATTEPQKVPDTILSRVQRFDFRRLAARDIEAQLAAIVEQERIPVDAGALKVLAHRAQGSMRDAEVLLDQVMAAAEGEVDRETVERLLGLTGAETYLALTERLAARDARGALATLDQVLARGAHLGELVQGLCEHLRQLLLLAVSPELESITDLTPDLVVRYRAQLEPWSMGDVVRLLSIALEAAGRMRRSEFPRLHLELALVEMAELKSTADLKQLVDRLEAIGGGTGGAAGAAGAGAAASPGAARRREATPRLEAPLDPGRATAIVADEFVTDPPLPAEPAAEPALPAGGTPGASDPRWGRIVERIKLRKTYLATLLAEVTRVELEDGVLALGFEPGQHFHHGTVSDPRNHAILIEEVRREFGPGVRIEVRQGGAGMRESPGAPAAPRGPAPARYSSGVEQLVERFGGVILD